jgi:hypothetical protein
LTALEGHGPANPKRLSACREHKSTELAEKLQQVEALLGAGKNSAARTLLEQVDAHFGGLATPKSVELASQMNALD